VKIAVVSRANADAVAIRVGSLPKLTAYFQLLRTGLALLFT
jgi:hypothetical protein